MNISQIEPRIVSLEEQDDVTFKSIEDLNSRVDALEETATAPEVEDTEATETRKKRLAKIEERLEAVEATLESGDDASEAEPEPEPEPDAASDNDTAADEGTAPDFTELMAAVEEDVKEYSQAVVNTAFYAEVCKKFNCWETVQLRDGGTGQSYPLRLPDGEYYVPSREMLDRILKETKVDEVEWVKDKEDCEDIARLFVQRCNDIGINSVGRVMAWSGGHAFCVAVVQDGTSVDFVFLEPQTDQIITDMKDMYDISNALIIIS